MPYVNERWLGGMLTNFATISSRTGKLREYEAMERAGDFDAMPKKEGLRHRRELEKLRRNLGGIRDLDRLPDAVFVIDTKKEHIAVTEANKLGMPIVAVVDTNCDPDVITYVIPGNDDAIRSGALMCRVMAEAVIEGRWVAEHQRAVAPPTPAPPAGRGQQRRAGAGTTGNLDLGAEATGSPTAATAAGPEASTAGPGPGAGDVPAGETVQAVAEPVTAPPAAAAPPPPVTALPEAAQPEAAQPEAAQPEAAQPEAAQPEAAQPEAAQPEAVAEPEPTATPAAPVEGSSAGGPAEEG